MKKFRYLTVALCLLLGMFLVTQFYSNKGGTQTQIQRNLNASAAIVELDTPAIIGTAEGRLLLFEPKAETNGKTVLAHPAPEVWLDFPETQPYSNNRNQMRVELPPDAKAFINGYWLEALTYYYKMEVTTVSSPQTKYDEDIALAKAFLYAARKIAELDIGTPIGKRKISHREAMDIAAYVGKSAKLTIATIKEHKMRGINGQQSGT